LLPPRLPNVDGLDLGARYHASGVDEQIGGDFYDVFQLSNGSWGVLVGDVCGADNEAAQLTTLVRYAARAAAVRSGTPGAVLAEVNTALMREHAAVGSSRRFVTAVFGYVTVSEGRADVSLVCAGHPPPLVIRSDQVEDPDVRGRLLGVFADVSYEPRQLRLLPGDALVLYTDGVTEARGESVMYGECRLRSLLAGAWGAPADTIAGRIAADAMTFQAGVARDDIAVVVVAAPVCS
jgi:sigma-B regulation protein RsbU (phosphoserine phosphatase)